MEPHLEKMPPKRRRTVDTYITGHDDTVTSSSLTPHLTDTDDSMPHGREGGASSSSSFATPAPCPPTHGCAPLHDSVRNASDLTIVRAINRGAHSKVWLTMQRTMFSGQYYALKVMSKARLQRAGAREVQCVMREKLALLALQPHPYIATLQATFQDKHSLYLVLQLGLGGDLRGTILRHQRRAIGAGTGAIPEETVRFYAAALVLVLQHLHSHGFAYRDLKPENVLLDADGDSPDPSRGLTLHKRSPQHGSSRPLTACPKHIPPNTSSPPQTLPLPLSMPTPPSAPRKESRRPGTV